MSEMRASLERGLADSAAGRVSDLGDFAQYAAPSNLDEAVTEHARHLACFNTRYDGHGGVTWQDDGGLYCTCEWTAPPDEKGHRPWAAWHRHVVAAVQVAVP